MNKIRAGDVVAYRQLFNFLIKCQSLDHLLSSASSLDSPDVICVILEKVPFHLQDSWNRRVQKIRQTQMGDTGLIDLANFIENKITLVSDPLFSRESVGQYDWKPKKPAQ